MLLELSLVFIAIILTVFLALFTYLKQTKSATNVLFFVFTIALALYNLFNFFSVHQPTDELTLFWIRNVITIAFFINLLFFLLTNTFPDVRLKLKPVYLIISLLMTLPLIPLAQTPLIFKNVTPHTNQPVPGPAIPVLLFHTVFFLGYGFFSLLKKYRKATGIAKKQLGFFLLANIFMFLSLVITNVLFVLVFHTSAYVGLLPLYTLIFVGFVSYAIVRHRFLDISFLVARSVAYIVLLLALGGFYSAAFIAVGSQILGIRFTAVEFSFFGLVMIVIAFSFNRARKLFERITDRFLYKGFYDTEELLKHLSTIMSTTIELSALTEGTLDALLKKVKITRGTYVLLEKKNKQHIGFILYKGYTSVPHFADEEINLLLKEKKIILFDDLEEGDIKKLLREHQISAILPLVVHDEPIGILALGEKLSGDIYSDQDVRVLEILGPQLAVAIQNAQEYEEIKRFNITLKEEVENATKELREANEQLKQLDKMKDEFVSLASHELKTPMASIKSYLWFLLFGGEKVGVLNEKQKMYADRAYNAVERLIKLVTDMLNMSRLEGGRIKLNPAPVDMQELVSEVVTELAGNAQTRQVSVEIAPTSSHLPNVSADADRIKEVVINLIGNSLKFTPSGGKVTVSLVQEGEMLKTSVTDTGKGITQEQMPLLFKKFGLIEGNYLTKASVVEGTGLGLYLSKSLIELHGGEMTVVSEGLNKGATFAFTLPVSKDAVASTNSQDSADKPLFHPLIPASPTPTA